MKLTVRQKTEPEVNLTSLIDVVLLLLIFFMVSTSFVKESRISIRIWVVKSAMILFSDSRGGRLREPDSPLKVAAPLFGRKAAASDGQNYG